MNILELCKCTEGQICSFCKVATLICFILLSGLIGYLIGKRKKHKEKTHGR